MLPAIALHANGDARTALNLLELAVSVVPDREPRRLDTRTPARRLVARRTLRYDKSGEEHYNLISALHKSLRNSDPDAAVYWLARMLESGEDLMYVARRLVRFASEDIGNADPQALVVAIAAQQAAHLLGMPEANTALSQAAIYLATAPKSNAVYAAYNEAADAARRDEADPVPLAPAQRADAADEAARVRQGVRVRPRRSRRGDGHGLPADGAAGPPLLPSDRSRVREGDRASPRRLARRSRGSGRNARTATNAER